MNQFLQHPTLTKFSRSGAGSRFGSSFQSICFDAGRNQFEFLSFLTPFFKSFLAPVFRSAFLFIVRLSRWRGGSAKFSRNLMSVHRITIIESSWCEPLGPAVAELLGWKFIDARFADGAINTNVGTNTVVSCDPTISQDQKSHGLTVVVADVCDLTNSCGAERLRNHLSEAPRSHALRNSENLRNVMMALRPANTRPNVQRNGQRNGQRNWPCKVDR